MAVECECLRDEEGLISARELITYLHYSLYMFSKLKFKVARVRSCRDLNAEVLSELVLETYMTLTDFIRPPL